MQPEELELVDMEECSYDQQELSDHFQRVLQSEHFGRSETLKKVLLYLWEHREEKISEYAVATEALGRRANFDPKTDASVRVQIARLRRKLKDYYEAEKPDSAYVLHIPVGSHELIALKVAPKESVIAGQEQASFPFAVSILAILCVALMILSCWLLWDRHESAKNMQRPFAAPTNFWATFIGTDSPIKIILPTPLFFTYPNLANIHLRDVDVNDFGSWESSNVVKSLAEKGGTPTFDQTYTAASDTLAAIDLARYLDSLGIADRVTFGVSGDSTMNLLEKQNVVAFGSSHSLHPFHDYLDSLNFSYSSHEEWGIENAHPASGELSRYKGSIQGNNRGIDIAIVAVLPGQSPKTKLLIMQSRRTAALVSLLTSKVGNNLFEKMYRGRGSPTYFEMLVEIEFDGDHIIRSWPVALHPYTKAAPTGAGVAQ